eukprot:197419-Rhodomonas_salina.1
MLGRTEAAARVRVGEAAGIASNLSSLNFIPENSLLASETRIPPSFPSIQPRRVCNVGVLCVGVLGRLVL